MRIKAIGVWIGVALIGGVAYGSVIKGKVECKGAHDSCDAVVYLANVPGAFKPGGDSPLMDQYRMEFTPHVLPILAGTTVRIRNSDPTMHNVYTPSKAGDFFNLGTWAQGLIKTYTFKQPGEVRLLCNVHPRMEAWILVFSNPYFAKTSSDGSYSLRDVPPGSYELRVWHEKLKFAPVQVQVPPGGEVSVRVASHPPLPLVVPVASRGLPGTRSGGRASRGHTYLTRHPNSHAHPQVRFSSNGAFSSINCSYGPSLDLCYPLLIPLSTDQGTCHLYRLTSLIHIPQL